MPRPKKTRITREDAALVDAFNAIYEEKLPARTDLLQATICAMLNRFRRMDEQAARQIAVFVQVLAARSVYWAKHRTDAQDGVEATREWKEYHDFLCEIALGERTKETHRKETILDQARALDRYLQEHNEFSKCRNASARWGWITKHGQAIHDLLEVFPCFCAYDDELAQWADSGSFKVFLGREWIEPKRPKWLVLHSLPPAKLRDALLALFHRTTPSQIGRIRKQRSSLTSHSLPLRPLDAAVGFPNFNSEQDISSQ